MSYSIDSQSRSNTKQWSNYNDRSKKTGQISSKAFFTNIKAQLSNIRTDVNKLVSNKQSSKQQSANKSINLSSSNYSQQNIGNSISTKTTPDHTINLQRRMSTGQALDSSSATSHDNQSKKMEAQLKQVQCKLNNEKQSCLSLKNQLNLEKQTRKSVQQELRQIKIQKMSFQVQKRSLQQSIRVLNEKIRDSQETKQKMKNRITQLQRETTLHSQQSRSNSSLSQMNTQYQEQIKNLCSNLEKINKENAQLRQKLDQSEKKNEETMHKLQQNERFKNYELQILKDEIKSLKNQKGSSSTNFKELGQAFEVKINDLLNQNYLLKNKITRLENNNQHAQFQIKSLEQTIDAFEERDRQMGKGAKQQELQDLYIKIQNLQQENDKMQSDHEYEIMKLENEIDEIKNNQRSSKQNKSLNQILKDQISEIELLRQKLKQKNEIISKMKR